MQAPADLNGPPPGFALVLEFDSPQQPGESIVANTEKGELNGMTFYRGQDESGPSLLQLDAKTMIVGNEAFINELLTATRADSSLLKLMNAQPSSGHIAAWIAIEPVRELIMNNLPPADQIPLPFQEFLEMPALIDSISLSVDLSGKTPHNLQIGTANEAAAKKTWGIMQRGISIARSMIAGQMMQEMSDEDQELKEAMQQYAQRLGDDLEDQLKPDIQGANLVFLADSSNQATSVATIGVLTGLLLPAVQQVREAARRTQSMNNLKQLLLGMHNFDSANGKLPAQAIMSKGGQPLLSWRVQILPYLDEQVLFDQFHQDEPWDSPHNIKLLDQMPALFQNPNLPAGHDTVYLSFVGPQTAFVDGKSPQFREIRDGLSNTFALVEADPEYAVPWTKPDDIEFDPENPRAGIQGTRPGGFIAAMFDGSVLFIPKTIDDENTRNLIMPNDGKIVRIR